MALFERKRHLLFYYMFLKNINMKIRNSEVGIIEAMNQGLILEINKKYMILAVSGADIVKGKKIDGAQVGDEVYFEPYQEKESFVHVWGSTVGNKLGNNLGGFLKGNRLVYLMINFVLLGSFVIPSYQPQASTYVSIDALSSIEIELDDEMRILDINGYNKQGKKLAKDLEALEGRDIEELMEVAISHRKERGSVSMQYQPCIVVTKTSRTEDKHLKKMNKVTKGISMRDGFSVRYHEKDEKFRTEALQHKLTPGRYSVFLLAKEKGCDVTVKSMRDSSLINDWMIERKCERKYSENRELNKYFYRDFQIIHNLKNSYFA